jgi:hypothetical protein
MKFNVSYSVSDNSPIATSWDLDLDLDGDVTFEDFKKHFKYALILISDEVLAQEQKDGFDKKARRRVDNKWDRPKESVYAFGKIEYYARQNALESLPAMYDMILKRSPVVKGRYRDHNYVYFNGVKVAENRAELFRWIESKKRTGIPSGSKIRFVNATPYAMRLELSGVRRGTGGKTRGVNLTKPLSKWSDTRNKAITKPNGTYVLAARAIRNKYKSIGSFVKFATIPNGFNGIIVPRAKGVNSNRTTYHENNKKYSGPYVYPSIVLDFTKEGALLQ